MLEAEAAAPDVLVDADVAVVAFELSIGGYCVSSFSLRVNAFLRKKNALYDDDVVEEQ